MDSKQTPPSSPSSQVQKDNIKPVEIFTHEDVKRIALDSALGHFGMNAKINKIAKETLPAHREGKISDEQASEDLNDISKALSLDSGHILFESMLEGYRGLAFQMKQDLHKEFDCKTASEKAMVDLAVSAYIRQTFLTKKLNLNQNFDSYYHEINGYFNVISKDIDRAHRQFVSAIETLKFMKQPSIKVNVKTNNAFIGEKQQFNNNVENNESK